MTTPQMQPPRTQSPTNTPPSPVKFVSPPCWPPQRSHSPPGLCKSPSMVRISSPLCHSHGGSSNSSNTSPRSLGSSFSPQSSPDITPTSPQLTPSFELKSSGQLAPTSSSPTPSIHTSPSSPKLVPSSPSQSLTPTLMRLPSPMLTPSRSEGIELSMLSPSTPRSQTTTTDIGCTLSPGMRRSQSYPRNSSAVSSSYIAKAVRDFVDPRFVIESSRLTDLVHIASGAFGKVFSGRLVDETGGNSIPIAAKRLQISTDEHLRNFLLELKVMSTVNSDSFTHFYGVCIGEPRRPLLIMELCPRGSLLDALADPKTVIGWSNALEILRDILSGLSTLHSSSPPLYHRDLKSGNCLLTAEGRVKLCDFGSARFAVRDNCDTLKKVRGNLAHSAPELYTSQSFTDKSDMYSFGIIMWELVNRVAKGNWELPFAEFNYSSPYQVLMQAAKNNRRPTMPPSVPQPIQDFYLRCVDPLPDNRPSSSQALTEITQMLYSYNANPVSWDGTTTS